MERPLKVLHVIPSIDMETGGSVSALIGFVNSLKGLVETEIATTNSNLTEDKLNKFSEAVHHIPVHHFSQIGRHSLNLSWELSEWLRENIANYDVIHTYALFSPMSTVAAFWARRRNIPYVINTIGTLSQYTFSSRNTILKWLYFELFEKYTLHSAAALHFTAPIEMNNAKEVYHFKKAVIIPNPVELAIETRNCGNDIIAKNILFMSRIHPKKGLDLLLPAFADITSRYQDVNLIIAGEGEKSYVLSVQKMVQQDERLKNRIIFMGFVNGEKKRKLLRETKLFILPSYDENFGIAVAEAMLAELPVIISDKVAIWPDIQEYGAGLVVPCDTDSIKKALEKLLEDPSLCVQMGKQGKRLVQDKYSPDVVGKSLFSLYASIIRNKMKNSEPLQC